MALIVVAALLSVAAALPRQVAPPADRASIVIPKTYFGMHIHRADRGTPWPGTEIGTWRLWDANALWLDIEPRRAQWDFPRLDRYVAMAKLTGSEILLPLGMTPGWASARPLEKGVYRPGDTAEPRDIEDWENYVSAVARRYKGRVRDFELWNEVNAGTGFFSGTPEAMLTLQKSAYRVVKDVDPEARLVAPSTVGESAHQLRWFEDYLALGAAKHADVIAYHFYQPRKQPEAILELAGKVRAIMKRHGAGEMPLWNTESGYRMSLGQPGRPVAADPSWPALDAATAEAYVARALILGWWAGIDRFYWYAWDNRDLGLMNAAGEKMPAGQAYLVTARWMTGARMTRCGRQGDIWQCELARDGVRGLLVWNAANGQKTWPVPGKAFAFVESLDGKLEAIDSSRHIVIDGRPRLLRQHEAAFQDSR
ncbi:MAG: hypothetical protein AB1720_12895 [Pseudomonadota bacterium]